MRNRKICLIVLFFLYHFGSALANPSDSLLIQEGSLDTLSSIIKSDFEKIEKQLALNEENLKLGKSDSNVFVFHSSASIVHTDDEVYLYWSSKMKHPVVKSSYGVDSYTEEQEINAILGKLYTDTKRKLVVYMASVAAYPTVLTREKDGSIREGYTNPYAESRQKTSVPNMLNAVDGAVRTAMYGANSVDNSFTTVIVVRMAQFHCVITKRADGGDSWKFDTEADLAEKFSLKHILRVIPAKVISNTCVDALKTSLRKEVKSDLKTFVNDVSAQFRSTTCNPSVSCLEQALTLEAAIGNNNADAILKEINALLVPIGREINGKGGIVNNHYGDAGLSYDYYTKVLLTCINSTERINAIKTLAEANWTSTPYEKIIIDFVKYTPKEQYKEFLDKLLTQRSGSQCLLAKLYSSVDLDEFDYLINELWKQIIVAYPNTISVQAAFSAEDYHWFGRGYSSSGLSFSNTISVDGKITLTSNNNMTADSYWEYYVGSKYNNTTSLKNPYDYVMICFETNYSLSTKSYKAGDKIFLPHAIAYGLFNYEGKKRYLNTGKLALDAGLCFLGVGEIRAAVKAGQYGFRFAHAIIDLSIGVSDIYIQNVLATRLETSPEGQKFLENWTRFQLIYGFGSIGISLTDCALRMKQSAGAIRQNDGLLTLADGSEIRLSEDEIKKLESIANEGENIVKKASQISSKLIPFFERLDKLGLDKLKKAVTEMDELTQTKFLDDFYEAKDFSLKGLDDNTNIVVFWEKSGSVVRNRAYPDPMHVAWDGVKQAVIDKGDVIENKILDAIEGARLPNEKSEKVMAGAYSPYLKNNTDVAIGYNNASFKTADLDPVLRDYIDYLTFIKKDFDGIDNVKGELYKTLYQGVPDSKMVTVGIAGTHAEIIATNEIIKRLRMEGEFNSIEDLKKIYVLVKGKVSSRGYENMCRCPHCFQIINGVNTIGQP